jgi:hypothetical protein
MNLSDKDRERLDELAKARDAGELSNEDYQRLCWATLKEKDKKEKDPRLEPYPENSMRAMREIIDPSTEEVEPAAARAKQQNRPPSLMELTTCNPSRTGVKRPRVRRAVTGLTPNVSLTQLFRLKRSRTTAGHAMLFPKKGLSLFWLFLLLVCSVVGTILVAQSVIGPPPPTPPNPVLVPVAYDFIKPLFGPMAMRNCRERCNVVTSAEGRGPCEQSCRYLSLAAYGRIIRLTKKVSAAADADEIISRCTRKDIDEAPYHEPGDWEDDIRTMLELLNQVPRSAMMVNLEQAQKLYDDLYQANRSLMMPPGGKQKDVELTKDTIRTTCMRTNLLLTEMGIVTAKQNGDEFSLRFYMALYEALAQKTRAMEDELLSQTRTKELMGYGQTPGK